jgi:Cu-processing system permease protein
MINLVMLIVPLMGLSAGANALAGERERGTLNYLLAQPLGRVELILGKYLGLALALAASLAIGFGLSAAVLASRHSGGSAAAFLTLVVLAMALALAMLSLGLLLSTVCRKASTAAGAAIFLWLFFAFFGDLGLMGGALALRIPIERLFHIALANPLQVFKIAAIPGIGGSIDVLGPAGLYATRAYGSGLNLLLGAAMGAWIVLPLALSGALFIRRRMP